MKTSSAMDIDKASILETHRPSLVESIDPGRVSLQSYLRSKFVLDDQDCQVIKSGVTRQERVCKMLDILALKGPAAIDHFIDALEFENPTLYETITGKKAEARVAPVPLLSKDDVWNWTTGIDGKALIDFDRQFLANQLDKALSDLKGMTYWQSKMMEEKNILERKLFEASDDLQSKSKYMEDLQEKIIHLTSDTRATETEKEAAMKNIPIHGYLQELWRDNMERNNIIIVLQSYIMFFKEQIEKLERTNAELVSKSDGYQKEIKELKIMHDFEKRNSKRLSETMACQTEKVDSTKKELLQLKFKCSTLKEERDSLKAEFSYFQKWTEILNIRFDELNSEKNVLRETQSDIYGQFNMLHDHLDKKETQYQLLEFQYGRSLMEVERLKSTLDSVRKQRNMLHEAKEDAFVEKHSILKEKIKLEDTLKEYKQKYQNDMEKHEKIYEELEKKHFELLDEVKSMENKAAEAEKALADANTALRNFTERKESECSSPKENVPPVTLRTKPTASVARLKQNRNRDSLIESIRRKVTCGDILSQIQKSDSLPAYLRDIPQVQQDSKSATLPAIGHCNLKLDLNRPDRLMKSISSTSSATPSPLPSSSPYALIFPSAAMSSSTSPCFDESSSGQQKDRENGYTGGLKQNDCTFRERTNCLERGEFFRGRERSVTAPAAPTSMTATET